uniref:Nuclear transcription factor, X-box binding-like 1 n=1 Tax=Iconisemion striatum TaxID=60296 RepID=A0A1A7XMV2_9TELE
MEPAWRQQGRGRGRGHDAQGQRSQPLQKERERPRGAPDPPQAGQPVPSRFEEIRKSNQAAAKRLVQSRVSSSSSDEDQDETDEGDTQRGRILESTFTSYTDQTGGDSSGLIRTGQYLTDLFQSGALTCLICIASVRRMQQVWSCSGCFSLFHLPCIQKWARDSVFLISSITDEDFGQKQHPWPCPKCRTEYPPSATPNRPESLTGATRARAPPADKPACCRYLDADTPVLSPATTWCWSGPNRAGSAVDEHVGALCCVETTTAAESVTWLPTATSVSQMIRQRCHCRISTLYVECTKLTSADEQIKVLLGSCNNQCPKQLSCGHRCKQVCHAGVCEEKCQQKVKLRCSCRRIKKEVLCSQSAQSDVQCDDICRDQQRKVSQLKEAEQRAAEEEEQRKLQEELEAFEKRQQRGGRRNKRRRREEVDDERGRVGRWWRRCATFILVPVGGVLLSAAAYYLLTVA